MKIAIVVIILLSVCVWGICLGYRLGTEQETNCQETYWRDAWATDVHKFQNEAKKYRELYEHELINEKWIIYENGNMIIVSEDGTVTEVGE